MSNNLQSLEVNGLRHFNPSKKWPHDYFNQIRSTSILKDSALALAIMKRS